MIPRAIWATIPWPFGGCSQSVTPFIVFSFKGTEDSPAVLRDSALLPRASGTASVISLPCSACKARSSNAWKPPFAFVAAMIALATGPS